MSPCSAEHKNRNRVSAQLLVTHAYLDSHTHSHCQHATHCTTPAWEGRSTVHYKRALQLATTAARKLSSVVYVMMEYTRTVLHIWFLRLFVAALQMVY